MKKCVCGPFWYYFQHSQQSYSPGLQPWNIESIATYYDDSLESLCWLDLKGNIQILIYLMSTCEFLVSQQVNMCLLIISSHLFSVAVSEHVEIYY